MFTKWRTSVACLLALCVSTTSLGAIKNNYVAPEARTREGGRNVYIIVPQAEIQPNINISNITAVTGGGLLFALIDAGINNARAKEAEKEVVPLREALLGFDFDPRVQFATTSTLAGLGWFDPKETKFTKDDSQAALLAALDAGTTSQLMVLRYDYETNADFSSVVVSLRASLVNKDIPKGKKPNSRLQAKYLAYNQTVRSFIKLPDPHPKDPNVNVQTWSANGGKAARAAIELGIERCQQLLSRSLALSAAEAAFMQKRNKRRMSPVPGITGWEIDVQQTHSVVYEAMTAQLTQIEWLGAEPVAPAMVVTPATESPAAVESPVTPVDASAPSPPPADTPAVAVPTATAVEAGAVPAVQPAQ